MIIQVFMTSIIAEEAYVMYLPPDESIDGITLRDNIRPGFDLDKARYARPWLQSTTELSPSARHEFHGLASKTCWAAAFSSPAFVHLIYAHRLYIP